MTITDADREALTDEIAEAISESLDMDWQPKWAAPAIIAILERERITAEQAGAPRWQDIATAPYNTPVIVEVGCGMSFAAQLVPDASMNSEDQFCDQWRAVHKGEHPPCWSGGACWERNENDAISMRPRRWRALDPAQIAGGKP